MISPGAFGRSSHLMTRVNYRTKICKYGKGCQYGERCFFAHSDEEIRPRSSNSSSDACKSVDTEYLTLKLASPRLMSHANATTCFIVDSSDGTNRRVSCESINCRGGSSKSSSPCDTMKVLDSSGLGPSLPFLQDIPDIFSVEGLVSHSGSTTPISQESDMDYFANYSYPVACIRYLQDEYSPRSLERLLKEAAPEFYEE